ncbi:hypothetical protein Cus16_3185 [Curtobacterium sp. ER1/6]|nr:hypothetical protein Cus16_3185 [Curtobacterium sp. ER1/6]
MLVAEEQPVATGRPRGGPLVQEPAERCDAGARADHDHRRRVVRGDPEGRVRLQVDAHLTVGAHAVGQVRRGDPAVRAPGVAVPDARDRQVDPVRVREWTRRDRVLPRLQAAEVRQQLVERRGGVAGVPEQVEDVAAPEPPVELLLVAVGDDGRELRRGRALHQVGDEVLRRRPDLPVHAQDVGQRPPVEQRGAVGTEVLEQPVDERRVVVRHDGEGVTGGVRDPGVAEVELEVPDLLRAAG